jgi:hypothetical protein
MLKVVAPLKTFKFCIINLTPDSTFLPDETIHYDNQC